MGRRRIEPNTGLNPFFKDVLNRIDRMYNPVFWSKFKLLRKFHYLSNYLISTF